MSEGKQAVAIGDYERMEIEEVFSRTRSLISLRAQIYSFFGTANLTLLGIALSSKQASFLFVAAGLIGLVALIDRGVFHYQAILASRGLELEKQYAFRAEMALLHRLYSPTDHRLPTRLKRFWLPLLIFTAEILLAIICATWLGWQW